MTTNRGAVAVLLALILTLTALPTSAWWHGTGGETPPIPPPPACTATLCITIPATIANVADISALLTGTFIGVADNVAINSSPLSVVSGISTLISGLALAQNTPPGTFTVTLSAVSGRFAVIGAGATGSGTNNLTLVGSFTAVNALLAATSFTGSVNDTITVNATDSFGNISPTATAAVTIVTPPAPPASNLTTTLDPSATGVCNSLTSGNLVVTDTGTNCQTQLTYFSTRSFAAYSAGKFYAEVTDNSIGACGVNCAGTMMAGIGNATASAQLGTNGSSIGGWNGNVGPGGTLQFAGGTVGTVPFWYVGDTLGIAVDFDAKLIWFRNTNAPTVWNAGGSANPATGVGGTSFSGLGGSLFLYLSNNGWNGAQFTANFGATAYAATAPAGFGNWLGAGTGGGNPPPVFNPQALRNQDFIRSLGVSIHLGGSSGLTSAQALADMQFVGASWVSRENLDNTLAAAGVRFDVIPSTGSQACVNTAAAMLTTDFAAYDAFSISFPGALIATEGPNEVNNFPVCWRNEPVTNGTTAAGNPTLHFASTLLPLQTVANNGYGSGMRVLDRTYLDSIIDPGWIHLAQHTGTTAVGALTINNSGEKLLACVYAQGGVVTGISDTLGLTWTKRASTAGSTHEDEWTATGPVGGSYPQTDTITITQTTSALITGDIWGVKGSTGSFDGSPVTSATDPVSITTTNANTLIFGCFHSSNSNQPEHGPGFTTIAGYPGALFWGLDNHLVEFNLYTSTQSPLSVTCGVGHRNNVGKCAGTANAVIADALIMSSPQLQPIPPDTTLTAGTATTVTLSTNVVGAGVGSGDTIHFSTDIYNDNQAAGLAWLQDTYTTTKADANLTTTKVWNMTSFPAVGVIGTADYNNGHFYPSPGAQPALSFSPPTEISSALPSVITETGYSVGAGTNGVNQSVQAKLLLNNWFDQFKNNVRFTSIYDLIDSQGETFGLFTAVPANAPKTSATVLHNVNVIMNDAGGTALSFSPGTLNYSIDGIPPHYLPIGTAGGHSMLFQRSDGHWFIIVWNEPVIWNTTGHVEVTPPPSPMTIHFGATMTTANIYDPITGTSPISTVSSASSIPATIGADPLIIELIP